MKTLTYTGELTITSCWCGIKLAVPNSLYRKAQSDSSTSIYCPIGHTFVYRHNEADRQRERAEAAERQLRAARASASAARDQAAAAERSARAYRGHLTRLRNKIANGVCPVAGCHRHFDQVQAHIETKHPEWAAEHPEAMRAIT